MIRVLSLAGCLLCGCGAVIASAPAAILARCTSQCAEDWQCERVVDELTTSACIRQCAEMCIEVRGDWPEQR